MSPHGQSYDAWSLTAELINRVVTERDERLHEDVQRDMQAMVGHSEQGSAAHALAAETRRLGDRIALLGQRQHTDGNMVMRAYAKIRGYGKYPTVLPGTYQVYYEDWMKEYLALSDEGWRTPPLFPTEPEVVPTSQNGESDDLVKALPVAQGYVFQTGTESAGDWEYGKPVSIFRMTFNPEDTGAMPVHKTEYEIYPNNDHPLRRHWVDGGVLQDYADRCEALARIEDATYKRDPNVAWYDDPRFWIRENQTVQKRWDYPDGLYLEPLKLVVAANKLLGAYQR